MSDSSLPALIKTQDAVQAFERAQMFLQGRHVDFIESLNKKDQEMVSSWLYEFWFFAFKTAKSWSHGPLSWDAVSLNFSSYSTGTPMTIPNSPILDVRSPPSRTNISFPPSVCRYTIHYYPDAEFGIVEAGNAIELCDASQEPFGEGTSQPRPDEMVLAPYEEMLFNNLKATQLTTRKTKTLPIAVAPIIEACRSSPKRLTKEALGFAIIGRNEKLVESILNRLNVHELEDFYPLHLATSYLDSSKVCCSIFWLVLRHHSSWQLSKMRNNIGHTVLDNLFVTIIRSHTTLVPGDIDTGLRTEGRFPGEEMDICGRWDADSDCFRDLINAGISSIPSKWKHKFCHTSAQTVCHCISAMYAESGPNILEASSTLFSKHCELCGLRTELFPLHMAVITAFHLAQSGMEDEDLFGILALVLRMTYFGARADAKTRIPTSLYFERSEAEANFALDECNHKEQTAYELASSVPQSYIQHWPETTRTGWTVLCLVLRDMERTRLDTYDYDQRCEHGCKPTLPLSENLRVLFTAIQTELFTYRRQCDTDPWLSSSFDMRELLRNLQRGERLSVKRLTSQEVMKIPCECGYFDCESWELPRRRD